MTSQAIATRIFRLLTSRGGLIVGNGIFVYFTATILAGLARQLHGGHPDYHELEQIIEGMAVLSVAFGVALESRADLMEILGLYPRFDGETERRIDQVCHDFGIGFLLFGLFMEIPNVAVKVPDSIFPSAGIETPTLLVSEVFVGAVLVASLLATWRLLKLPPLRAGR
jgi:hypothetical protein